MTAVLEIAKLKNRLASASTLFSEELFNEPEPYSTDEYYFRLWFILCASKKICLPGGGTPHKSALLAL
jgi:hypothetical protein